MRRYRSVTHSKPEEKFDHLVLDLGRILLVIDFTNYTDVFDRTEIWWMVHSLMGGWAQNVQHLFATLHLCANIKIMFASHNPLKVRLNRLEVIKSFWIYGQSVLFSNKYKAFFSAFSINIVALLIWKLYSFTG